MVKIYLDKYSMSNILLKLDSLNKYLYNNYEYNKFISNIDGIYYVEDKNIYKIDIQELNYDRINNFYKNIDIIIDNSIYIKKNIYSYLPINYINICILYKQYKINKEDDISLYIEFNEDKVIDFYFDINKDIEDNNIKERLKEFLDIL